MILGITGGLGCGKSTAASGLARRGFRHIDTDAIVRDHVLTRPEVLAALEGHFGGEVLKGGAVNRPWLAAIVFADDSAREWLEALTHPVLFAEWRRLVASAPAARWAVEAPLLFEKQLENWFDFIVCVTCAPDQQLTRLEQRGLPRALAEQRISKQLPLARKIELADFALSNDGSTDFLDQQISLLLEALPPARR